MAQRRIVTFANSTVAIEYADARAARIVDFLFRDAPTSESPTPHVTLRIAPSVDGDRIALYADETLTFESESDAVFAEYLLGQVGYHLADKSQGGLVFHSAALGWRGRAVLVPGGIGRGKTTLTAWLVNKGLDYLTDELVFVPNDADAISALTRPLSLKERVIAQNFFDFERYSQEIFSAPGSDLIPARLLGNVTPNVSRRPGLWLFPHYQLDTQPEFLQLTPAQTAFSLLECLINARNLPEHGMSQVVRLAKLAPAYRLRYAHFDQIENEIDRLLAAFDVQ
jgi:hypothetical protein